MTAPVDRIRLTIQVDHKVQPLFATIKNLYKDGGIRSFWRGNFINVIKVAPEMSIRFGFYEKIKQLLNPGSDYFTIKEKFVAGAGAGILGQLVIYPLEVLKTRLTVGKTGEYNGIIDAIKKVYKQHGWRGFYSGYKTSAIGIIPYTGIDLAAFETLKKLYVYTPNYETEVSRLEMLLRVMSCATFSTTLAQCASYPFYLVKARQQASSKHPSNIIINKWKFCQLCQILYTIIKGEGLTGLYRGLIPSLAKVLPASAINYAIYEYAHGILFMYLK